MAKCLSGWLNDLKGETFSIAISFCAVAAFPYEKVVLLAKLNSFAAVENKLKITEYANGDPALNDSYIYDNAFVKDQTSKESLNHFITLCFITEIIQYLLEIEEHASIVFFNDKNYRILDLQDSLVCFYDSNFDPLLENLVFQINKDYAHSTCEKYFQWSYKYG